jgi:hypothetical protein
MSNLPQKSDSPASIGLGDSIAKITSATKLDVLAEKIAQVAGASDCGCKKRQQTLNQMFPYNTQQSQSPFPRKSK